MQSQWRALEKSPLYLAHVDANDQAVDLYSLWPIWWPLWQHRTRVEIVCTCSKPSDELTTVTMPAPGSRPVSGIEPYHWPSQVNHVDRRRTDAGATAGDEAPSWAREWSRANGEEWS
jgi:hypothetical protein